MNSRFSYARNRGIFSGIVSNLCGLSTHLFILFLFAFFGMAHFTDQIYWLFMGTYIKGIDEGGVAGGWDGHPEGNIAGGCISHDWASYKEQLMGRGAWEARWLEEDIHFPWTGILPNSIWWEGECPVWCCENSRGGRKGCHSQEPGVSSDWSESCRLIKIPPIN